MKRVVILPSARRDIVEIWSYISDHDERAADRLVERFERAARSLGEQPFSGSAMDSVRPGLRKKSVRGYLMFYRVTGRTVRIIRVLHGARDAIWRIL